MVGRYLRLAHFCGFTTRRYSSIHLFPIFHEFIHFCCNLAIIATCWASMMYYGRKGYVEATKKIVETHHYIEQELRQIKGIRVCGQPEACVVAIDSVEFDIYRVSDAMAKKG